MPILGIDLGASATKTATPTRSGVVIVRNDLAERTTPTLVAYTDKERLIGDAALTTIKSNASRTIRGFKQMLGVSANDDIVISRETPFCLAPLKPTPEGFMGYDVGLESGPVTAVQALVPFIKRLVELGTTYIGAPVSDVLVAVPSWFREANSQAVADACQLAGVGCIGVIPHTTATALDYGIHRRSVLAEKSQEGGSQTVVFCDIGYSAATLSAVEFTRDGFTVLNVWEDATLGGRAIDYILVDHLLERAGLSRSNGTSNLPRAPAKVLLKLEEAAEKAKKVLSANKEAGVHLECLYENNDLDVVLTRSDFEALMVEYRTTLEAGCQAFLQSLSENARKAITTLEIAGGITRIPFVQASLEAQFGLPISRTVSADECVARGAALLGATLDPRFRVVPFKAQTNTSEAYILSVAPELAKFIEVEEGSNTTTLQSVTGSANQVILLERGFSHGHVRWVTVPIDKDVQQIHFGICQQSQVNDPSAMTSYCINVEPATLQLIKDAKSSQLKIRVFFDTKQVLCVEAFLKYKVVGTEEYTERVPVRNADGEIIENEFEEKQLTRPKTSTRKVPLQITIRRPQNWLTEQLKKKIVNQEHEQCIQDEATQRARTLRNDILTKCFRMRGAANGNDQVYSQFVSDAEKNHVIAECDQCEMFAEDNEDLPVEQYQPCWDRLQAAWKPIQARYDAWFHEQEQLRLAQEARERAEIEERERAAAAAAAAAAEAAKAEAEGQEIPNVDVGTETAQRAEEVKGQ